MTRWSCLMLPCLAALLFVLSGCSEEPLGIPHTHNPDAEVTLCGLCGEIKDSEKCCKAGVAAECPICGLHKGSILCCSTAINGRRDVVLCRKCGEVAFGKKCCQPGPVLCTKCGLHKGSPGCCKIEKVAADVGGDEFEHAHEGGHS
jgi:hypothetical protein